MMKDTFQNFSPNKLAIANISGTQNLAYTEIVLWEDC